MSPGSESVLASLATAALVLFIVYRRFRRSFGRQLLQPRRMIVRTLILCALGLLLLPTALRSSTDALAIGAGAALGVTLGVWGAQHTRFERHEGKLHYVPHTYTGMVVSALFLGRLLYRLLALPQGMHSDGSAFDGASPAEGFGKIYRNPLTLGVFFVLIGYYVYYYSYVLRRSRQVKRGDAAAQPTSRV